MAELPSGTVTFLFSDIEGSTQLLRRLGDAYPGVLADHQRLLRRAWADHHGVEIDTQGDSFFVVFARATDATAAAAQAQRALAAHAWPPRGIVRVRMGLHTGVGTLHDGHYVGLDVHRAARIAAAGHGGQVLLSQATRDQVAKELVAGAGLRDLGKHRLKDLPRREEIYQLVLDGMPTDYPPLKTLDAWPGLRADLTVVAGLSLGLLAVAGLLLPLVEPAFPRWIGLAAAGAAGVVLLTSVGARPVRRILLAQWRDARKPVAVVTSSLLSLVVVLATLFVTKPAIFLGSGHLGYDFTYTPHAPTRTGGTVVLGTPYPNDLLVPGGFTGPTGLYFQGLWQSCVVQLPDVRLRLESWKPDQCTEVPTVDNGGQSPDYKTTTFHIDSRAVWSDGLPITADDFRFAFRIYQDPTMGGGPPLSLMTLTKVDSLTVRINWSEPYPWYLDVLAALYPLPLHVYAEGRFAGVYNAATGAYNSALARQLVAQASFNVTFGVDNGPFTVRSVFPPDPPVLPVNTPDVLSYSLSRVVLARNPRFFSNFFRHPPALDQVTVLSFARDGLTPRQAKDAMIASYRKGELTLTDGLDVVDLSRLGGIPTGEVRTSPQLNFLTVGFNQRGVAPNARANGGVSIFTDPHVRRAFVEAFDRCAAVRAQLGVPGCTDPNLFTDEYTAPPAPDYDATVHLPAYNPADAAALLNKAGYPLVHGVRRAKDGKTPLEVTLLPSTHGEGADVIVRRMLQDYAKNLGVHATILPPPDDQYAAWTAGAFDLLVYSDGGPADTFTHDSMIQQGFDAADIPSASNPGGTNIFGLIDPQVIQRNHLGAETQDPDQRARVYQGLQRYLTQRLYFEPIYVEEDVALVTPTLCNFAKMSGNFGAGAGNNTWNMADWYVAPSCP